VRDFDFPEDQFEYPKPLKVQPIKSSNNIRNDEVFNDKDFDFSGGDGNKNSQNYPKKENNKCFDGFNNKFSDSPVRKATSNSNVSKGLIDDRTREIYKHNEKILSNLDIFGGSDESAEHTSENKSLNQAPLIDLFGGDSTTTTTKVNTNNALSVDNNIFSPPNKNMGSDNYMNMIPNTNVISPTNNNVNNNLNNIFSNNVDMGMQGNSGQTNYSMNNNMNNNYPSQNFNSNMNMFNNNQNNMMMNNSNNNNNMNMNMGYGNNNSQFNNPNNRNTINYFNNNPQTINTHSNINLNNNYPITTVSQEPTIKSEAPVKEEPLNEFKVKIIFI
jgi:hypothetical protein